MALAAATLAALLGASGGVSVIIGRPGARQAPQRAADGEVTVTGAVDGSVDEQAGNGLADLGTYWTQQFPDVFGQKFESLQGGYFSIDPGDVDRFEYPQGVGRGADPREAENNAFYCQAPRAPNSDAITYDREFLGGLAAEYGRFLPAMVMAHEFGHAVQARVGLPDASITIETQADCLTGAWTAARRPAGTSSVPLASSLRVRSPKTTTSPAAATPPTPT